MLRDIKIILVSHLHIACHIHELFFLGEGTACWDGHACNVDDQQQK